MAFSFGDAVRGDPTSTTRVRDNRAGSRDRTTVLRGEDVKAVTVDKSCALDPVVIGAGCDIRVLLGHGSVVFLLNRVHFVGGGFHHVIDAVVSRT
jgi:hypothetical protein